MRKNTVLRAGILLAILLLVLSAAQPVAAIPPADGETIEEYTSTTLFNVPLELPNGARIDYLRLYYYDTNTTYNSKAWITAYAEAGVYDDVAYVASLGSSGLGQNLSAYSGHIVSNSDWSYVLNWRPFVYSPSKTTSTMELMGMRVAYCLSFVDNDPCPAFHYVFITGSAFTPVNSSTYWSSGIGDGGVFPVSFYIHLPLIQK
jgi:hypothetical protein